AHRKIGDFIKGVFAVFQGGEQVLSSLFAILLLIVRVSMRCTLMYSSGSNCQRRSWSFPYRRHVNDLYRDFPTTALTLLDYLLAVFV
ncbi:hypothetical protein ACJX0J_014659, partial [Zea mays]